MAAFDRFLLQCCLLLLIIYRSKAITSPKPKALVLPVVKDAKTLQYITQINQRTPLVPVKLTVHLGGIFLWVDCYQGYVSSTYRPVTCGSAQCKLAEWSNCPAGCYSANPPAGKCNFTCNLLPDNPIAPISTSGDVGQDVVSIQSTDGSTPGEVVSVPDLLFTCGSPTVLRRLAIGVTGMAGLGRSDISLPSLFSSAFKFDRKFAICLSSSAEKRGVIFFGPGPYMMPDVDIAKQLKFTPLIRNPVSTSGAHVEGEPSFEYFIGVTSIKINGKAVNLNSALLNIDKQGNGGTKISTVNPYTVLETSIYNAVVEAFSKELGNVSRVSPVAPFGACYNARQISTAWTGAAVPNIDLVLQSEDIYWRFYGANSMETINEQVMCLGFVNGGSNPRTSIVIGGHQIEDNLLQFDLANKRLGFSSSLWFNKMTCAGFRWKPVIAGSSALQEVTFRNFQQINSVLHMGLRPWSHIHWIAVWLTVYE